MPIDPAESFDQQPEYGDSLDRERLARHQAEVLAKSQSLDLYAMNQELRRLNATLEQRVRERTIELEQAVRHAQHSSDAKGEFLAKMSHEIRTPMNGVIGMLEALRSTQLDATQLDYVNTAASSADALLSLINDILDFSKIEAGKLSIECIDFDLHALVQQIANFWQPQAEAKHLKLLLDMDRHTPRWLRGDPNRLHQVLTNLFSNAMKFTSEGSISLSIDPMGMSFDDTTDEIMVRFAIQDTGIGMSPETLERLFQQFEQADGAATSRVYGGTGLGLAIIKQLIDLMKGDITVDSEVDLGTSFTVILPFAKGQPLLERSPENNQSLPVEGKHILVVDDNETNRKVAIAILERLGFKTSFAVDGLEAVHSVQDQNFDLVMMDCHMPIVDGIDATKSIRAWERAKGRTPVPIVAVSASAFQDDKDRCADAGMNDFLPKPITLTGVKQMLGKWLSESSDDSTSTPTLADAGMALAYIPESYFNHEQFIEMQQLAGRMFTELLQRYLQDSQKQIDAMQAAAVLGDASALKRSAHKLKGSSASMGAYGLSERCNVVESQARDGRLDNITAQVAAVSEELTHVTAALNGYLQHQPGMSPDTP